MAGLPPGLERMVELYRRGDVAGAVAEGKSVLARDPDSTPLLHLLGVLSCQAGLLEDGAGLLRRALRLDPADTPSRQNLVRALVDLGRRDEALEVALAAPDGAGEAELDRMSGFLLHSVGRHADAVLSFERSTAADPQNWEGWSGLAGARAAAGDRDGAIAALERAVRIRPDQAALQYRLGVLLVEASRAGEAVPPFAEAAALEPANVEAQLELARLLNHLGRHDAALAAAERALALAPERADARNEKARALGGLQRPEEAEPIYRALLAELPDRADAWFELGLVLERTSRVAELGRLLEAAAAGGVAAGRFPYLQALVARREGRLGEALALAESVPAEVEPLRRAQLIGRIADRLGDTKRAFDASAEMNAIVAAGAPGAREQAKRYRERLNGLARLITPEWHRGWRAKPEPGRRQAPVFLVGFPRSGTTLLDTILLGHPDVHVLEEVPLLQRVDAALGGMAAIATADAAAAERLRTLYFEALDPLLPPGFDGLVVDKLPLNMLGAPLIHFLFPDARFVFAERHPCDVVLSAFMQHFEVNDAMANFLDIGDAAKLYDLAMTVWQRSVEVLPIRVHRVRYERLVADAGAEIRPLADFLGLGWDEAMLDHRATAEARGHIVTPSYDQVTEPLYRRASGRWRRYEKELAPVLPILLPWAERLGYE